MGENASVGVKKESLSTQISEISPSPKLIKLTYENKCPLGIELIPT